MTNLMKRTRSGRYYGIGATHTYSATREGRRWVLRIAKAMKIGDLMITDPDGLVDETTHDTLTICRMIADTYEALGDSYQQHENGHVGRSTRAHVDTYNALIAAILASG